MPVETWSDDVLVVHLADDPQFTDDLDALDRELGQSARDVVADLGAVGFVNSSNISRLLRLRRDMNDRGRKLVLCSIGTGVWSTFLVTGLDKIFTCADNVPLALASLQLDGERTP